MYHLVKLDTRFVEKFFCLIDYFVAVNIESEIELPGANGLWNVSIFISDRESNLDELGLLYVAPDLVELIFFLGVLAGRSVDTNAREFGVLRRNPHTIAITLNF